ncbi:hypothetical protein LEP1GSC161_3446 [Leptospira santarosai str. CBC1416]|uniref:Uncharacterized protein n=1 Tax=Leptospira santarosai str. CBC1416 TaxID=1193059 RepID=M6VQM0_9LEPT|nr:hypothetical protein LEP1GSC161_3446 [Leptospira santarosai str. CBC1416]
MLTEFKTDDPEGTKNSILQKIKTIREELTILLQKKERTYDSVIRPLNDLVQEMQIEFTVLAHLNSVKKFRADSGSIYRSTSRNHRFLYGLGTERGIESGISGNFKE